LLKVLDREAIKVDLYGRDTSGMAKSNGWHVRGIESTWMCRSVITILRKSGPAFCTKVIAGRCHWHMFGHMGPNCTSHMEHNPLLG
jgi:hypothetical protein